MEERRDEYEFLQRDRGVHPPALGDETVFFDV